MRLKAKLALITLCAAGLTGCVVDETHTHYVHHDRYQRHHDRPYIVQPERSTTIYHSHIERHESSSQTPPAPRPSDMSSGQTPPAPEPAHESSGQTPPAPSGDSSSGQTPPAPPVDNSSGQTPPAPSEDTSSGQTPAAPSSDSESGQTPAAPAM